MSTQDRPTIDHTEIAPAVPGSPLECEWETYRREVGSLIAAGHEGEWVLIKGEEVIGCFASRREAIDAGSQRFFRQPILVHQVLSREPVLRYFPRHNWVTLDSPHAIHHTQLAPMEPGSPLAVEWEFYRREVGNLIAAGHAGEWVLIKDEEVIGFFASRREAIDAGFQRFFRQPILVHQVLSREPVLLMTPRFI